jgi:hypothetical protein
MIGFVIGAACLFGLIAVARRGRHCAGGYGGWGHRGGWGRHGGWGPGAGFGGGPRFFLRRLFMELGTSPSQEKVIVSAAEELHATLSGVRGEFAASRGDVAQALRSPTFTGEALGSVFSRHDEALTKVREAVTGALARVHDVLDDKQREALANFIERGRRGGWGGPYRSYAV